MKLISLKIRSDFRSLKNGFEINFHSLNDEDFSQFHPFCFAGLNGSGKSNVLEALAEIFYFLDCCTLPQNKLPKSFKDHFQPQTCRPDLDDYDIEYLIGQPDSKSYQKEYLDTGVLCEACPSIPVESGSCPTMCH